MHLMATMESCEFTRRALLPRVMILLAMSLVYDVHTPRFRPEIMSPRWLHVRCCVTAAIQQKPSTILPNPIISGIGSCLRDALGEAASLGLPYHRAECGTFKVKERYNLVSILFGARLYRLNATPKRHTARLIRRCEAGLSPCLVPLDRAQSERALARTAMPLADSTLVFKLAM